MEKQITSPERTMLDHALYAIRYIMFPWWFVFVLTPVIFFIILSYFNGFDGSVWVTGTSVSKGFLGVVGILLSVMFLPLYVTNGMTRRHFVIGGSIVVGGTAIIGGLLVILGFGIEEVVYSLAGVSDLLDDEDVFRSAGRVAVVFIAYALGNAAYMCSGWLIGSGYYRYGPFKGTLFIAVALIPVIGTEYLLNADSIWNSSLSIGGPVGVYLSLPERIAGDIEIPVALAALLALAVSALGLLGNYRLLRDVAIK